MASVLARPSGPDRLPSFQSGRSLHTVDEETSAELSSLDSHVHSSTDQQVYSSDLALSVRLSDLSFTPSSLLDSSECSTPNASVDPLSEPLHDVDYTLRSLWTLDRFERLVETPEGLARLRHFLQESRLPSTRLDLYVDLRKLARIQTYARFVAVGIRDGYTQTTALNRKELDDQVADYISKSVEPACDDSAVTAASQRLLRQLYANEFEQYIQQRLLVAVTAQLASLNIKSSKARGLGEAFVLSNPRLPDCPIVLASPAFSQLTGYSTERIVGRNCRFLQGKATSPESIRTIKKAIIKGEQCTQLILNYTLQGRPFWNLLCILPLYDAGGHLTYLIGGQTDVSLFLDDMIDDFEEAIEAAPRASSPFDELLNDAMFSASMSPALRQHANAPDTPPLTPMEAAIESGGKKRPTTVRASSSGSSTASSFFGRSRKTSGVKEAQPLHDTTRRPLEDAIKMISGVYERVVIVSSDNYRVTYVTPSFLELIGQTGASEKEAARSPLLDMSFFDLLYGKTDSVVRSSSKAARQAIDSGVASAMSLQLKGVYVDGRPAGAHTGAPSNKASSTGVQVNAHFTPLHNMYQDATAFVVIITPVV